MNVCLGLISIVLSVFIGFRLSRKFNEKKCFYQSFHDFNKDFNRELTFNQTLLLDIVSNFNNNDNDFNKHVYNYFYFEKQICNIKYLTKDESNYFYNYLSILGTGDKNSQIKFINETQIYLDEKLSIAIKDEKKYKNLYIKLGLLFGLILFIIFLSVKNGRWNYL